MKTRILLLTFALALAGCAQNGELPPPNKADSKPEFQAVALPQAPPPRAKIGQEDWPSLIIGTWRRVQPRTASEVTYEVAENGLVTQRVKDGDGVRIKVMTYTLAGNVLTVHEPKTDDVFNPDVIRESTTYIDSLTEDKLVTVTIERTRWVPERAAELAKRQMISVEQLLAEVGEKQHIVTAERVKP